jgi:SAM-dependent methyltransferase
MPKPIKSPYQDPGAYFAKCRETERVARFSWILAEAERLLGRRGRLLDVGSGRGELLVAARGAGWQAVGVEPSEEFAKYSRHRHGVEVLTGTLESAYFESDMFDFVVIAAVLEHVFEPLTLLREARRVLQQRGVLYVGVPNEEGLYFRALRMAFRMLGRDWVVNLAPTFEPYHVYGFSPRSLQRALELANFRIEYMQTFRSRPTTEAGGCPGSMQAGVTLALDSIGERLGSGSMLDAWARAA